MKKLIPLFFVSILQGARITPDLQNALQTAGKDELIRVNLVMEKQFNALEFIKQYPHIYRNKKVRRNFVKEVLKEFAKETQRPVIEKLKELEKQGLVRNIRAFWIANVINFEGTKDAILQIQKLSGIKSLDIDEERPLIISLKEFEKDKKFAAPDNTAFPLKTIEWNILHINAPYVWQLGYRGQSVIVAVLDTGVRYTHFDLADHIWINPSEIPNNGLDDDGNGYVDDIYGYDFGYYDPDPMDGHGHGTHVAGTVAGDGTAGNTTGVAPDAIIMCVKVLDDLGGGYESGVWEGMQYAADNGADIITMSLGWRHAWNPDRSTWRSICDNITAMGVVITVAAGNERSGGSPPPDNIRTPGDVPPPWIHPDQDPLGETSGVITVGATDISDNIAYFSSYGPVTWENISPYYDWPYQPEMGLMDPDVTAPGVNIVSLSNLSDNGYTSGWDGTSMATPHVAGLVALMLSKNPNLTPREVDSIIELYGVIDLGPTGKDNDYGSGRIDCLAAINATPEPSAPDKPIIISPYNFAKLPVLTPVFKFITRDPQGDDVIYRIYWSTDTTFSVKDSVETPPYPSDSIVEFSLPVELLQGETYWFRIRATDTTSSGLWSLYSSKFSFTIDTTLPSSFSSWFQTKGAQFKYNQFYGTRIAGDSILLEPFGYIEDTLLIEDFEQGIPPIWTVVDGNNDGAMWTTGTTSDLYGYEPPNYGTKYAYYSDDDAGNGVINYNEELISPKIFIPGSASNLSIKYGYGFRVYQTGEVLDFYARFFSSGVWTSWTLLKSYTSSASDTENLDLTFYLPADSVQFKWVYHDENSSSHWGWAAGIDNVVVSYSYYFQNNEGAVTTVPISFQDFLNIYPKDNWGYLIWEKGTPEDSVGIQVEYYDGNEWQLIPDTDLPGNSTGFFTIAKLGSVSLESLDTTFYKTLRLKALFYRKDVLADANEPSLLSIEVGAPPVVSVKETEKAEFPYLKVSPLIFRDYITFKFSILPLSEARLKIFNSSGRLIKEETFKSEKLGSEITYIWDAKGKNGKKLSSGIYFIKFENDKYRKTLKALLIK